MRARKKTAEPKPAEPEPVFDIRSLCERVGFRVRALCGRRALTDAEVVKVARDEVNHWDAAMRNQEEIRLESDYSRMIHMLSMAGISSSSRGFQYKGTQGEPSGAITVPSHKIAFVFDVRGNLFAVESIEDLAARVARHEAG